MKKILLLKTIEEVRTMTDPYRLDILKIFQSSDDESLTVKQVADALNEAHGKVYYHIKKLEKVGALILDKTIKINGITAKYYKLDYDEISIHGSGKDEDINRKLDNSIAMISKIFDDNKTAFVDRLNEIKNPDTSKLKHSDEHSTLYSESLYFDKSEIDNFTSELKDLIKKYSHKKESENTLKKTFFYSVFTEPENGKLTK